MRLRASLASFVALLAISIAADAIAAPAASPTRTIKIISSAGARGLVEGCTAWAQKNNTTVAMAVLDWGGNLIESHAMEGAAPNAIDTALLKAKNALRWRRPSSETAGIVKRGENMAPTYIVGDFPQPGAVPIVVEGQVIGSMGVSSGDGEKCAQAGIESVFGKQTTAAK
jgi:glc operon protein GlcG